MLIIQDGDEWPYYMEEPSLSSSIPCAMVSAADGALLLEWIREGNSSLCAEMRRQEDEGEVYFDMVLGLFEADVKDTTTPRHTTEPAGAQRAIFSLIKKVLERVGKQAPFGAGSSEWWHEGLVSRCEALVARGLRSCTRAHGVVAAETIDFSKAAQMMLC